MSKTNDLLIDDGTNAPLTEAQMQEVLQKYDKESSTRIFSGKKKTIMRWHDNTNRRFEPHWYLEAR